MSTKHTSKKNEKPARRAASAKTDPEAIIQAAKKAAFASASPEACFNHFKERAAKVSLTSLAVFTGQPLLMRSNVLQAIDATEPHLAVAVKKLASPNLVPIFELPALVLALDFAVTRVPVASLSAGDIDRMLNEGAPWRELMLDYLEVASHPLLGLLPAARVAAVRAGAGKLDKARDFVALPGLFAEFEGALADKHPFSNDKIAMLGTLGSALIAQVKPGRAKTAVPTRSPESILRDQFAALVSDSYDELQVICALAIGKRAAEELLPALRTSIAFAAPSAPTDPAPAPAPPSTPIGAPVLAEKKPTET